MEGPAKILVVEDEAIVRTFLVQELERLGYAIAGPAGCVREAMQAIAKEGDRIVGAVLDLSLGHGETSLDIARELQRREIPFLFLTGDDGPLQSWRDEHAEALTVLLKPVSLAQLRKVVGEVIAAPSP